jgi:hypothetical protein
MIDENAYVFFVAVKRSSNGHPRLIRYSNKLEQLKAGLPSVVNNENKKSETEDDQDTDLSVDDGQPSLRAVMRRVVEAIHAQSELIPTAEFMGHAVFLMETDNAIAEPAEKTGDLLSSVDGISIYGLGASIFEKMIPTISKISRMNRGLSALPAALLMSIVATFDSNMADLVRAMLKLKPTMLQASEKSISLAEVLKASSIEEVKARILDDELYLFSRGSHEDQVNYIEKMFHISIAQHWKRWPDFIEVFERRNLVAHGEQKFTQRYVSICSRHGHKGSEKILGKPINLGFPYLSQANAILLEFSILLIFSLWRKHLPEQEMEAFDILNGTAYELIRNEEYIVPIRVLDYVLGLKNVRVSDSTRRMMIINLASAHAHNAQHDRAIMILDEVDWSATSDNFKICVAALKKDVTETCRLLPLVCAAGSIKKSEFRDWPVFDLVREDAAFIATFERFYGESIVAADSPKLIDSSNTETGPAQS